MASESKLNYKQMEINSFFRFSSKLSSSAFQVGAMGLNKTKNKDSDFFDEFKLIQGLYDRLSFPIVFKHYSGTKLYDVLDTGWASLYLISDRLKATLQKTSLTGWKTYPVKVLDKNSNEISGYNGFSIIGRSGSIDYTKSEIIEKRRSPNAPLRKFYKGLHFGLEKWDKSDFFLPEKNYGPIVTERAAEILNKNKFTNIELKNLSDVEMNEYTARAFK